MKASNMERFADEIDLQVKDGGGKEWWDAVQICSRLDQLWSSDLKFQSWKLLFDVCRQQSQHLSENDRMETRENIHFRSTVDEGHRQIVFPYTWDSIPNLVAHGNWTCPFNRQKFQVLDYKAMFGGWVFPYISRIHTAYIDEYLYFRYLKCLVI